MMTHPSFPGVGFCEVCGDDRPRRVAEDFRGGRFVECAGCGVHFAEAPRASLNDYYRDLWSAGNLGCRPYADKVEAARDPARLEGLLTSVPRFRWAARRLRALPRGAKVLDVGCGEGAVLWEARRLGLEPHGCDLAAPAVELARGLVGRDNVHVATVDRLPYAAATFDGLLALEVLEHLPNPRPFLDRVARLLKPEGVLLLTVPNRHRAFAVAKRALGRPHSSTDYPPHHYTRWSAGALRGLLGQYFARLDVSSLPYHWPGTAGGLAAGVVHALTGGFMGQSLCVAASAV